MNDKLEALTELQSPVRSNVGNIWRVLPWR